MAKMIVLTGVVQGVFCRNYCAQYGRKMGIRGFASNLSDGSVRVILDTNEPEIVREYILKLKTNPYAYRFYGKIDEARIQEYSGPLYGDYSF